MGSEMCIRDRDAAPEVEPEDDYNPEPPEVETPAVGEVPTA